MDDRNQLITSKQLMTLIITAMTGVSIISLPSKLAKDVGHDGWITIIISGALSMLMAVVVLKLLEKYSNKSILEINSVLYGKFIGTVINVVYLLYLSFKTSINIRIMVEVVQTVVLKSTPAVLLTVFMMIPTVYITWYGLKPICRFASTIYLTIFFVLVLLIVQLKMVHPTFLLPVMECGISSIISSVRKTAYAFLIFAYPWLVYPMITDKEKTLKYTIKALIFSTIFFLCIVVFTTAFFGEGMLKHLSFPLYSVARVYKAPIFERIDLFFLVIWFPAMHMSAKAYFWGTKYWIDQLLRIKKTMYSLLLYSAAIIALSRLPGNISDVNKYLEIADMFGIPLVLGMAVFGYIFSSFKVKGGKKS